MKRYNWIVVAVVIGFALFFASKYGGNIPYMFLWFSVAIPLVSGLYVLIVLIGFRFYQKVENPTMVKGEANVYNYCITNESPFFMDGVGVEFKKGFVSVIGEMEKEEYRLAPGETINREIKICCNCRGEYEVGISRFAIRDYFRLFEFDYKISEKIKVMVLPRVTTWKYEQEILEECESKRQNRKTRIGNLDVQVREYVPGDSMRQIHWKAAAKQRKLMSREEYENQRQEVAFFFDLRPCGYGENETLFYEDEMLEQLVSAVAACRQKGISCNVIWDRKEAPVVHIETEQQWELFYEMCGKAVFQAKTSVAQLTLDKRKLARVRCAVFFTNTLESTLVEKLHREYREIDSRVILVSEEKEWKQNVTQIDGVKLYHSSIVDRGDNYDF